MIIKGLFRRYERWNPVHPTSGAFWGMGVGLGCGVGWGPGFGPEVVGYVGAGCGVGFSVGITFVGLGVGLPANCLLQIPFNAFEATRAGALEFARFSGLLTMKTFSEQDWSSVRPRISGLQREASERFIKHRSSLDKGLDLSDMNRNISAHTKSILDQIRRFSGSLFRPQKGVKD